MWGFIAVVLRRYDGLYRACKLSCKVATGHGKWDQGRDGVVHQGER